MGRWTSQALHVFRGTEYLALKCFYGLVVFVVSVCLARLLGSLLGMSGPKINRVKPRVEMTLEAANRRELLKALVHTGSKAEVRVVFVQINALSLLGILPLSGVLMIAVLLNLSWLSPAKHVSGLVGTAVRPLLLLFFHSLIFLFGGAGFCVVPGEQPERILQFFA